MTRTRTAAAVLAAAAVASLLTAGHRAGNHPGQQPRHRQAPTQVTTVVPAPPKVTVAQIDRQDRVSRTQRRREAAVFDRRPLLNHLPLRRGNVFIAIGGLAADDATTVILLRGPDERQARRVYRRELRRWHDSGALYATRFLAS